MSVFSNQLFISPERPVDPFTLSILDLIDRLLRDAKIRYMLVGATARDLLLYHVFGHAVTRATYDLDFAILVDSWEQFAIVKQLFLDIPGFTDKGRNAQRLYYRPSGASFETIIDIIPFGKLESADRTIAWPPDADVVMNVAAFSDVFENSLRVQVGPDLIIPVASLSGLMVLKLFAWLDRHEGRDLQDIRRLWAGVAEQPSFPAVRTAFSTCSMLCCWPTTGSNVREYSIDFKLIGMRLQGAETFSTTTLRLTASEFPSPSPAIVCCKSLTRAN